MHMHMRGSYRVGGEKNTEFTITMLSRWSRGITWRFLYIQFEISTVSMSIRGKIGGRGILD